MAVTIRMPRFMPEFVSGTVRVVHAGAGMPVAYGTPLADIAVDFGGGQAFDCPPITYYRIMMGEGGRLAEHVFEVGREIAADAVVGTLEAEEDDVARDARLVVAAVLLETDWWDD